MVKKLDKDTALSSLDIQYTDIFCDVHITILSHYSMVHNSDESCIFENKLKYVISFYLFGKYNLKL